MSQCGIWQRFVEFSWSNRLNKALFTMIKTDVFSLTALWISSHQAALRFPWPIVHWSDWSTVPVTWHCRMAEPGTEEGCLLACGLQWAYWKLDIHCFVHRKSCRTICCGSKHNRPSYWPQGHCPLLYVGFIIQERVFKAHLCTLISS